MKIHRLALAASALLLLTQTTRAELPPSAYEEMRAKATECVEIEITRVALNQRDRDGLRDISVFAHAVITGATRSQRRLKIGDKISLRYLTFEVVKPGWVGPGPIPVVKVGGRGRAWLNKSGAHLDAAARKHTFEEKGKKSAPRAMVG